MASDPKIIALREKIGKEVTGNPDFKNSDYLGLDAKDKISITNLMKAEIAANPDEYSPNQVKVANTPEIGNIEEFTFGDAVSSAVQGATEGAVNYGNTLKTLLTLAAIASGAVAVIELIKLAKPKGK